MQIKCKFASCNILLRLYNRRLLRSGFIALRIRYAPHPPPPPTSTDQAPLDELLSRVKNLEVRVEQEAGERAEIEGRVLGLVMGSLPVGGTQSEHDRIESSRTVTLPQDPTKLFRSLSHETEDNSDDDLSNACATDRFLELPSTSHRSPPLPEFYPSSSFQRRLKKINERVDKILDEASPSGGSNSGYHNFRK